LTHAAAPALHAKRCSGPGAPGAGGKYRSQDQGRRSALLQGGGPVSRSQERCRQEDRSKAFSGDQRQGKEEIFSLCRDLLETGYGEEAFIAFQWSYNLRSGFQPADFSVFESWLVRYVDNWAKCDTLCNHALGSFLEMYPEFLVNLKGDWALSENRWLRRASAVTLILPARKGLFLEEAFAISEILLQDKDDMVQKGYGWLLKEASKKHQEEVFNFVMRRKAEMPRTALRYAIEKMPTDLKKRAMAR